MSNTKPLGHIEHVVVLMFENRSFDNVLGDLYPYGPDFDGVPPGWSNPDGKGGTVAAFTDPDIKAAQIQPFPDPNEDHDDMEEQINGGKMDGFVTNYAKAIKTRGNDTDKASNIMQYYSSTALGGMPITSALAKSYGVSDCYFGSGPVQTWPNRLFAHCGTPGFYTKSGKNCSYLNNCEYPNYDDLDPFHGQLDYKTVFELLDEANSNSASTAWKVYYDGEVPISAFLKYVHDRWNWLEGGNVYKLKSDFPGYADFAYDVSHDTLPTYSFIEPRYQKYSADGFIPPNSNHPGGSTTDEGLPPIDVIHGEALLRDVFQTLASNKDVFDKTLLMITYDEHGGLFDHVAPSEATSPFADPGGFANFPYTSYGPRVPAIFINPYVAQKVLRPDEGSYFDHTSIIATLRDQFCLQESLTPRVSSAPTFTGLIDSSIEPNYGPDLPSIDDSVPQEYFDGVEPENYLPPKHKGTVTDAVYRSYIANKGRNKK